MAGKRRSTSQLTRDRRKIADLYLQGWLQADIARELGVSQLTISNDIKALHRQWLTESLIDFGAAKARELAKIDALERTYHTAWIRSCEDAETTRQEGSKTGVSKIVKTAKGQAGDPRFLAGIQWCIERRCKIMGIDAPTKMDLRINELDAAIEFELARLAATGQGATSGAIAPESGHS